MSREEFLKFGMAMVSLASEYSHDPDTQTGCAVFDANGWYVTKGTNRIPRNIIPIPERTTCPEKYNWIEHAERDAIYGFSNLKDFWGGTMFLNWFPCKDCARAIVSVGIKELVYVIKPERLADPRYEFDKSTEILTAGGVVLTEYKS